MRSLRPARPADAACRTVRIPRAFAPAASVRAPRRLPAPASLPAAAAAAALAALLAGAQPAMSADLATNWATKCAGCHAGGGNVVAAGATLFTADLEKNGATSPDAIYALIYGGKAKMPGFGADCAPKARSAWRASARRGLRCSRQRHPCLHAC
jgi:cytochrome c6